MFLLVNLAGGASVLFKYFPAHIQTVDKANWEAQDITIGAKPLFYGNREPRRVMIEELMLDSTDDQQSVKPDLDALYALQIETRNGTPPALLAIWGDQRKRCVLSEVNVNQTWFDADGSPQRAKVSLTLVELQPLMGQARVSANPISNLGNF